MTSKRILVVEDDALNMKLARTILSLKGFEILEATEAEIGLNLAQKHKPDLILMDIQLPGMDGLTATGKIKNNPDISDIPVIALTSHAMEGDEKKAIDAGCDGYITKPIRRQTFLEQIGLYLKRGAVKPQKPPAPNLRHRDRILIVDDEPLNIKLLAAKLQFDNYEILTATGGRKALEIVASNRPDIILLDIMMPEMNGYEVIRRLKSSPETENIPIILVTALNQPEHKKKGMDAGADDFLNKPVNTLELQARVRSLLKLQKFQEQLKNRLQTESEFSMASEPDSHVEDDYLKPSVLLVDDNEKDIRLMRHYLSDLQIELGVAKTGDDALKMVLKQSWDVILLDLFLPGMSGSKICKYLKSKDATRNIQVVIITATDDLNNKIRCIELGTDDFIVKPVNREEIKARIMALVKKKEYIDRLRMKYDTAVHAAMTDKLTGLFNQAFFKHSLEIEINRVKRHQQALGLLMIDVDNFKRHNDTLGHQVGDDILHNLGGLIKKSIRDVDLAARYGGEEFSVLLPYADTKIAMDVAERIRSTIETADVIPESAQSSDKVTVSIGVAIVPSDANSARTLIKYADSALYRAKDSGKNRVCHFNPDTALTSGLNHPKEDTAKNIIEFSAPNTTTAKKRLDGKLTEKEKNKIVRKTTDKRFGTIGIEKGYINPDQLNKGLEIQNHEDNEFGRHRLIGQILVSKGWLTDEQVQDILDTMSQKIAMAIGAGQ